MLWKALSVDGGEVRIDVRREEASVDLCVSDNGRGMTPQTLERIFEPFFTEKRGASRGPAVKLARAADLGLSISYAIIQSHGGSIVAESLPGLERKGSRFLHFAASGGEEALKSK